LLSKILSPADRLTEVREKLEEYRAWGVPHIWLVDPHSRRLYSCGVGLREVPSFTIAELDVEVTPDQVFE
jgi:Uma2 family endonuclease